MDIFPKYKDGDTIISGCYFTMQKGSEMLRIRGARKWYAPWKRYGDVVMIDIRVGVIGDADGSYYDETRAQFESECG